MTAKRVEFPASAGTAVSRVCARPARKARLLTLAACIGAEENQRSQLRAALATAGHALGLAAFVCPAGLVPTASDDRQRADFVVALRVARHGV